MTELYDFNAPTMDGGAAPLSVYRGKVLLIVNVASECGFTPQYAGLQVLQEAYVGRGFSVLGFPCNQFGGQEPGDAAAICSLAEGRYGVTFPLFAKIEVNGPGAHPLWTWLATQRPGVFGTRAIKWNFSKFLVGRDGRVIKRFGSRVKPEAIAGEIERALGA
jgi:glutathione peroxidase